MTITILTELLKRPIAYNAIVAKAFGSVKLGILWSQLYYWHDKTRDEEGWIYKTQQDIYDETGLSRKEQETARKIGRTLRVLEEKIAGQPAKVHYRIDLARAEAVISKFIEEQNTGQLKLINPKEKLFSSIGYLKNIPKEDVIELANKYHVNEKCVLDRIEDVVDYCEANGNSYKDYKAALRNFIKIHLQRNPGDKIVKPYVNSKPIEQATRTPEQQARLDKQLTEMRKNLANKFSIKK